METNTGATTLATANTSNSTVSTTASLSSNNGVNSQLTPFSFHNCHNSWSWKDGPSSNSSIYLKPTGVRTACMPSNWDQTFDFMPGVCPHEWEMRNIAEASVPGKDDPTIYELKTTAYCCPGNYTLTDGAILGMSTGSACSKNFRNPSRGLSYKPARITIVESPDGTNPSASMTRTFLYGDVVQPAWHILWNSDERGLLLPTPPSLTAGETIATWTPPSASPVYTSTYISPTYTSPCETSTCSRNMLGDMPGGVFTFLITGLPAIVGVLLISCCTWCCVKYRRESKRHKQWQIDAANREAGREVPLVPLQPGMVDIPTHLGGGQRRVGDQYARTTRYTDGPLVVEPPMAYTSHAR